MSNHYREDGKLKVSYTEPIWSLDTCLPLTYKCSNQQKNENRFEYVKAFEQPDILLPNTWIVVRIDGRGFTKLCARYGFEKPNDRRALDLMNAAAKAVMGDVTDITVAYGVSDEFRSVLIPFLQNISLREDKARLNLAAGVCLL